jgi:uncharacterized protein with PQ loop repeat
MDDVELGIVKPSGNQLHNRVYNAYMNKFMMLVATVGSLYLLIQGIYIFIKRNSDGFSLLSLTMSIAGQICFLTYALFNNDKVLAMSSVIGVVFKMFIIFSIIIVNTFM